MESSHNGKNLNRVTLVTTPSPFDFG